MAGPGYLRWRTALNRQHATEVGTILAGAGYDGATIEQVQRIIRKEGLRTDPAVQTHEDALCLVFLETQLVDLADRLGDDKSVEVIAKTAAQDEPTRDRRRARTDPGRTGTGRGRRCPRQDRNPVESAPHARRPAR